MFTLAFLWLALRDVDFREVGRTMARADWLLLFGLSIPTYAGLIWLRALRWKELTAPVAPISTGALFRATSVGFMGNNIFPLRMGEVLRCLYLSRESGASTASLFATVVLERVIDAVCVLLLILMVLSLWGAGGNTELERGVWLVGPILLLPIGGLVLLRVAPERVLGWAALLLRPFPQRLAAMLEGLLRRFTEGLGALGSGRHLVRVVVYSILIWLVLSPIPIVIAFAALGIDLGGAFRVAGAAYMTQAAVGVAVALPSAPGFFGIFHAACRFALVRFGVGDATAVAAGTLIHAVMWLCLTGMGLLVLRFRRTSLGDLDRAAASEEPPAL